MRVGALALLLLLTVGATGWGFESVPRASHHPRRFGPYVPPSAAESVRIGYFYLRRKAYPGALDRFLEALRSDQHYAPVYLGLGRLYERLGKRRQALAAYKRYLAELPSEKQAEHARAARRAIRRLEPSLRLGARIPRHPDVNPPRH